VTPSVSVVVVAAARIESLPACLDGLCAQTVTPHEVIVVDASAQRSVGGLVSDRYPQVSVRAVASGPGAAAAGRRAGWLAASGEIVAFLGEDVVPDARWLAELSSRYRDPLVAGVGGRLTGEGVESDRGIAEIGLLLPVGRLTGNFTADPRRDVDADYLDRDNMSVRYASALAVGGIPQGYYSGEGDELVELCLRLRADGFSIRYAPTAMVSRVPAGEATPPFWPDLGAGYRRCRDRTALLVRRFGRRAPIVRHHFGLVLRTQGRHLAATRARFGPRMADGSPRPAVRRVTAPVVLARGLAELAGLVAGFSVRTGGRPAGATTGSTA